MTRLDRLVATLEASLAVAAAQLDRDLAHADAVYGLAPLADHWVVHEAYIRAYGFLRGAVAAHLAEAQR